MAVKLMQKVSRGCGDRQVGGLYLFCAASFVLPCNRLPLPVPDSCPCCGNGIKQVRGITMINPLALFGNNEDNPCPSGLFPCQVCYPPSRGALLWVGKTDYTPLSFSIEARQHGISKRIAAPPKDLKKGDMIYFAHPEGAEITRGNGQKDLTGAEQGEKALIPGVFLAARFTEIQKVISKEQAADPEYVKSIEDRGIVPVLEIEQPEITAAGSEGAESCQ